MYRVDNQAHASKVSSKLKHIMLCLLCISVFEKTHAAAPTHSIFDTTDRLIIKWKPAPNALHKSYSNAEGRITALNQRLGTHMISSRKIKNDLEVVQLPSRLSLTEANALSQALLDDINIEYAEPDRLLHAQLEPNDWAYVNYQWHYYDKNKELAAANLPGAWDITTGHENIVIAVLDSGILPHMDLAGRTLPGYDFINNTLVSNDGDGRDNDPTDPGDWITASESAGTDPHTGSFFRSCPIKNSSWHGTHVTGTIAAISNGASGTAGINWVSKVVPVRILGKCGGFLSDIIDAMRWAAGIPVLGAPTNANPAQIINMSLGGAFDCSTSPAYQSVINEITALGVSVVVAAGNSNQNAKNFSPAGCDNVITVAASNRLGGKAAYSNYGDTVEITAPGGYAPLDPNGILSTLDSGTTTAVNDNLLSFSQGTSMAAPHVAGVVSLMQSAYYDLTSSLLTPEQVVNKLTSSAREFPALTGSDCTHTLCGSGLLDATRAIQAVTTPPTANAGINRDVLRGHLVTLDASNSTDDGTITSYQWVQLSGSPVTLSNTDTQITTFTAPTSLGPLSFQLTVADDLGLTDSTSVTLEVIPDNTPPISESQTLSTNEDTPLDNSLLATDAENNPLVFQIVTPPTKGNVTITNTHSGAFIYTPNPNISGIDTFTFRSNDGEFSSNIATITVNIIQQNDPPSATHSTITTREDIQISGTFGATDIDSNVLEYIVVTQASKGYITLNNSYSGEYLYTPYADMHGTDSFTYKVSDGMSVSNEATITITINPENDPATANNFSFEVNEDVHFSGVLNATDPDNEIIFYSISQPPEKGHVTQLNNTTGEFNYVPYADLNGVDNFTYTVTDGKGQHSTATVSINIVSINDAPRITPLDPAEITIARGGTYSLELEITDPDTPSDSNSYTLSASDFSLGYIRFIDNTLFIQATTLGQEQLDINATDSTGLSDSISVTITVNDIQNTNNSQENIEDSLATELEPPPTTGSTNNDGGGGGQSNVILFIILFISLIKSLPSRVKKSILDRLLRLNLFFMLKPIPVHRFHQTPMQCILRLPVNQLFCARNICHSNSFHGPIRYGPKCRWFFSLQNLR